MRYKEKIALSDKDVEKIREIEVDILDYVDRICNENSINYSLADGTLIGAIRHKGFIPWDDDIDVMMTRENYNRFCEIVNADKNNDFFLLNAWNNEECVFIFSKVMAKNTIMKELSSSSNGAPCGVFIDVFPLDYASNAETAQEKFYKIREIGDLLKCRGYYYFG